MQENILNLHQSARKLSWWVWAWWELPSCKQVQPGVTLAVLLPMLNLFTNSEKLMKLDAKRREYDVVVIGEEAHVAYNRVGLTSFFQHRKVENLYLKPKEWVRMSSLAFS